MVDEGLHPTQSPKNLFGSRHSQWEFPANLVLQEHGNKEQSNQSHPPFSIQITSHPGILPMLLWLVAYNLCKVLLKSGTILAPLPPTLTLVWGRCQFSFLIY